MEGVGCKVRRAGPGLEVGEVCGGSDRDRDKTSGTRLAMCQCAVSQVRMLNGSTMCTYVLGIGLLLLAAMLEVGVLVLRVRDLDRNQCSTMWRHSVACGRRRDGGLSGLDSKCMYAGVLCTWG